jgi:hypothetical protein
VLDAHETGQDSIRRMNINTQRGKVQAGDDRAAWHA